MYSYPPFPKYSGEVTASGIGVYILGLILWFLKIPLIGIVNILVAIFSGIANGTSSSMTSIVSFPGQIFSQTVSSFSPFGIFAPIAAAAVWGVAIIILIFFIFKAIQLAAAETTEDV